MPHTWKAQGRKENPSAEGGKELAWMRVKEGMGGGGVPCEALRDPYALMTQASDTNYCYWLRNRPKWCNREL